MSRSPEGFLGVLASWRWTRFSLFAKAQTVEERGIALHVVLFQVIQQATPVPDELQQSAAGRVVLGMGLEMFRQVCDPLGDEGDLNFWGTGVRILLLEILDQLGLLLFRHHKTSLLKVKFHGW